MYQVHFYLVSLIFEGSAIIERYYLLLRLDTSRHRIATDAWEITGHWITLRPYLVGPQSLSISLYLSLPLSTSVCMCVVGRWNRKVVWVYTYKDTHKATYKDTYKNTFKDTSENTLQDRHRKVVWVYTYKDTYKNAYKDT